MNTTHMSAPAPTSRLRLTRRGRVVFTGLAAVPLVVVAMVLGLNGGMATATGAAGAPLDALTVTPGQSMWALASAVAPDEDPREVIASFVQVNQLDSVDVVAGQQLLVPAKYSD